MNLRRFFHSERFIWIVTAIGLMPVFAVVLWKQRDALSKYHIPVIGWIMAMVEHRHASAAYQRASEQGLPAWQEFHATQTAFDHTYVAFVSTLAFLALAFALINALKRKDSD